MVGDGADSVVVCCPDVNDGKQLLLVLLAVAGSASCVCGHIEVGVTSLDGLRELMGGYQITGVRRGRRPEGNCNIIYGNIQSCSIEKYNI